MAQIANSEITTSSIADFTSQEWKVKSIIQSEISRDETSLDDIIPELSSASEHAINVQNFILLINKNLHF